MKHLKTKLKKTNPSSSPEIVIDRDKGLVFKSEDELYKHFFNEIESLENQFYDYRKSLKDVSEEDFKKHEEKLTFTLEMPDEIWKASLIEDHEFHIYIKVFEATDEKPLYYTAVVYLTQKIPSFVYLHFPSQNEDLIERYRQGELLFSRTQSYALPGAIEGDALVEGDEFAVGLYEAMLLLRSSQDIAESQFQDFAHLREETVEQAEEIWRADDSRGNVLVNFIKEFPDENNGNGLFYVVITIEDIPSNSHALLFSFPSNDPNLIERYRQGDNLQAEEVIQESSH